VNEDQARSNGKNRWVDRRMLGPRVRTECRIRAKNVPRDVRRPSAIVGYTVEIIELRFFD
jgi:hypothetical protein